MHLSLLPVALFALTVMTSPLPPPQPKGFDAMGSLSAQLSKRQDDWSVTRNELAECKAVTVIFARGTIELGNVGSLVGPPFFNALDLAIGAQNVAVQGVDYPATLEGYLQHGDPGGAKTLAALTEQAASQCPDTQIVLSGYSQGAQEVHLGAALIPPATAARVAAVVVFGDPDKNQALPNIDSSNVQTFCFEDDLICDNLPVVDAYHLSYAVDAVPAALFVKNHVNL